MQPADPVTALLVELFDHSAREPDERRDPASRHPGGRRDLNSEVEQDQRPPRPPAEAAPTHSPEPTVGTSVAVLDDAGGAITAALLERGLTPSTWCDDLRSELLVPEANRAATPTEAVIGATTVLWRLPRALGALDEYAQLIATHADPAVQVVAAERNKHLNRSMNDVLGRHFTTVHASLGRRKARALLASGPRATTASWPRSARIDALALDVVAHGATFSSNRLDRGTALLAGCIDEMPASGRAVDLGCGSGILAALLARRGLRVSAVDVAWSATDATRLTAAANGVTVEVERRNGLEDWHEPIDLVVSNPPFHIGTAKDTSPTRELFAQAGRLLVPGGELWCVYNSHLPYLAWLRESVGPTTIVARDRSYLVTRSRRSGQR